MKSPTSTSARRRLMPGFTLVELMVSMVISTIILLILLRTTGAAVDSWRLNRERIKASRQAKVTLDQISKDFESFQVRGGNGFEWLYAKVDDEVGRGAVDGGTAAKIAFFTGATDRYNGQAGVDGVDKGGDISAVGYRLVFKDPVKNDAGEFAVFALYRNLINPDKSFQELLRQNALMNPDVGEGAFQHHMDQTGDSTHFVCENIYDLSVSFLIEFEERVGRIGKVKKHRRISVIDTSGGGVVEELRIRGNGISTEPPQASADAIQRGRLVSVEIGVTVITESAMEIIRGGDLSGESLAQFIARHSYRHSETILLPEF